jgi:hypothetical protein
MAQFYSLLADFVVVIHFLYVLFAVGGLVFIFLGAARRWKTAKNLWFRVIHLVAVVLVGLEAATGFVCPLTNWEYDLRLLAGSPVEQNVSFVARLARAIIFYDLPEWVFAVMHIALGLLVIATFILVPPHFQRKKRKPSL